jgi:hypothetical protein
MLRCPSVAGGDRSSYYHLIADITVVWFGCRKLSRRAARLSSSRLWLQSLEMSSKSNSMLVGVSRASKQATATVLIDVVWQLRPLDRSSSIRIWSNAYWICGTHQSFRRISSSNKVSIDKQPTKQFASVLLKTNKRIADLISGKAGCSLDDLTLRAIRYATLRTYRVLV